jgi:hypothetical protein
MAFFTSIMLASLTTSNDGIAFSHLFQSARRARLRAMHSL